MRVEAPRAPAADPAARPHVSVVVPNWNGRAFLERCLASLRRQTLEPFEVIVVDGGSSDRSVERVRDAFPEVRVIVFDRNVGFAAAANAGARAAAADYVAFLNNDTEPAPECLEELVACLRRHPGAASAACRSLRLGDEGTIDGAGDAMTWSLKAYRRGAGEPDGLRFDVEEQVFSASGTGCLWRAKVFHELSGFDEDFFAYYEDVDLGFRARLAGYECWYAPRAVLAHVGAATASAAPATFDTELSVRNRWATVIKNVPASWLVRHAPAIVTGECLWLARSWKRGDLRAHVRGYQRVLGELPKWRANRVQNRPRPWPDGPRMHVDGALPRLVVARSRPFSRFGIADARRRVEAAETHGSRDARSIR